MLMAGITAICCNPFLYVKDQRKMQFNHHFPVFSCFVFEDMIAYITEDNGKKLHHTR